MTVSARRMAVEDDGDALYVRIGEFLDAQGLSPHPPHYEFAHRVVSQPDGPVARAVALFTEGGVRLTRQQIESLGGTVVAGSPVELVVSEPKARGAGPVDALIAKTQMQVEGFADTVKAIHAETTGFGRDLAASAAAMHDAGPGAALDEITRMTSAMIERVHSAEVRLAEANREADALRVELDEARGSARQDPLTELPNRRAFDEAYAALDPATPVVVALCDIDHFKRVNDEFGHAVGDRVLKAIGQTLTSECENCLVARYGGEEFAVLVTGTDIEGGWAVLERARSAVAAKRFRSRETDAPLGSVTLSIGISSGVAGAAQELMFERADAALYRAKAAGRNRVFRAPEIGA